MGGCNSGDHVAEDYFHTDIITCNIEETQVPPWNGQIDYGGGGGGGT